jgi:hypothetical protein
MHSSTQTLAVEKPGTPIALIDATVAAIDTLESPAVLNTAGGDMEWSVPAKPARNTSMPNPARYVVVTEDAALAEQITQASISCMALCDTWPANPAASPIYKDPLPQALLDATSRCSILLLQEANATPYQAQRTANIKDALLYQGARWVRTFTVPPGKNGPTELSQLIQTEVGQKVLIDHLKAALSEPTEGMTPFKQFVYRMSSKGKPLHYTIPDYPPNPDGIKCVIEKQVEDTDSDGHIKIVDKPIASTCIWVERVIHRLENDEVRYEMGYMRLCDRHVGYLTGGAELLNLRDRDNIYARHGASIQSRELPYLEEFLHACQVHGHVKHALGSLRRGWIETAQGWHFLMTGGVITTAGHFDAHHPNAPLLPISAGGVETAAGIGTKGNAQTWARSMLDQVLTQPLPALFCGAVVGGVLRQFCPDSENFILHLYGQSSGGKTTVLKAAASILGDPGNLVEAWRATDNGLESKLATRNDLAMFLDECSQQSNPEVLENSVYLIGNGAPKSRAKKDGSARDTPKFRLVALSTGEETLVRGEKKGGQEVRALEIAADVGGALWGEATGPDMERLSRTLVAHHGWGLEPLVQDILARIQGNPDYFHQAMAAMTEGYRRSQSDDAPVTVMRRCKHFALATLGYWLLLGVVLDIAGESNAEQVREQHLQQLRAFVANHLLRLSTDQYNVSETDTLLAAVAEALGVHGNKIQRKDGEPLKGETWGYELDHAVAIYPGRFRDLVHPYDKNRVLDALTKIGAVAKRKSVRLKDKTSLYLHVIDRTQLDRHLDSTPINPAPAKPGH